MPPKKGKGKGRKGDDEELWAGKEENAAPISLGADTHEEEEAPSKPAKKGGFAAGFAGLSLEDPPEPADENEDFGGLMSAIKTSAAKGGGKKDKKKKKNKWDDYDDEVIRESIAPNEDGPKPEAAAPVEMTAEELADEEWGPTKGKGKKGKKGKASKDDAEEEAGPTPTAAADEDEEGDGKRVLSKKEKDRLKKEREKEKKKQESAAKKSQLEASADVTPAAGTPAEPAEGQAEDSAPKKLSKKQKAKLKEALGPVEEEQKPKVEKAEKQPPGGKKATGKIAALRAAMEEKKRLEEEAARKAEEERKRLEEEERKKEEEEKRRKEEAERKREQAKLEREQAIKEGRILTPKQRKAQQAAEERKRKLMASGQIIGTAEPPKPPAGQAGKFKYGGKQHPQKKLPPGVASSVKDSTSVPASPALTETTLPDVATASPAITASADTTESWEEILDEPEKPAADVKDDWELSSDEETKSAAKAVPEAPKNGKPAPPVGSSKPASKSKPTTQAPVNAKPGPSAPAKPAAPAKEGSESEEDSEEDSDEDSEEDSDDDDSDEDSSDEELTAAKREAERRKTEAAARKAKRIEEAMAARSKDDLRSPICCILGHVDTGKTSLLDKIRQTNVQEGEAGGITQQIGATYFPVDAIKEKTKILDVAATFDYKVPGLLIIDTPGHESFTNLRSRGSSLCNIAVLVVDIMHGLEPQTLESLRLLRDRKTPFIVALNKVDRMYGWEATPNNGFRESLAKQKTGTQKEFEKRTQETILAFAEQGLNAKLYYENDQPGRIVSLVPTSAVTGEGVPDMIQLLVTLTQQRMTDKLMYLSEVECTVLEVKVIEGLGTTIDVVLSNGILREGDRIVVCGLNGPIVTQIRALLTPQPLRELRIKSAYVHHKEVKAALGVKITGPDLDKAIAGSRLLVCGPDDDEDELREEVMSDLTSLLNFIDRSGRGVCVQASTLGSLEALLDFLKTSKIPVSGINIGPVHKKDIMRASTMLEKARELACILCFDVPVDKEAEILAKDMGIRLFKADIIYHLFDAFTAYNNEITEAKRRDAAPQAVWPCRLKIIACFAKREPIILGCDILDGQLRVGTPLCVVKTDAATGKKDIIRLGKITSLEINHKSMEVVKKAQAGAGVAVKIEHAVYESAKMFGRHFDDKDEVISLITRQSIDTLKETFRQDVSNEEWLLIKNLKPKLGIP